GVGLGVRLRVGVGDDYLPLLVDLDPAVNTRLPHVPVDQRPPEPTSPRHDLPQAVRIMRARRLDPLRDALSHLTPTGDTRLPHVRMNQRHPRLALMLHHPTERVRIMRTRRLPPRAARLLTHLTQHPGRDLVDQ